MGRKIGQSLLSEESCAADEAAAHRAYWEPMPLSIAILAQPLSIASKTARSSRCTTPSTRTSLDDPGTCAIPRTTLVICDATMLRET
jgi:hypothetical protein